MAGENNIVRFGLFELDVEAAMLRKSGVRIKLQEQPLQILTALLERPGEIVSRDELRRRLWPEDTFVDFDHSLNASVNKLREALGDAASNARFIETVPRRGYRFIAPVERPEAKQPPLPSPQVTGAPPNRSARMKLVAAAVAISAVAAVVFVAAQWLPTASPKQALTVVPLTSNPGSEIQPAFSPDGNYVVYAGGTGAMSDLNVYIKQIGSESVRQLTSDPAPDRSPKWSPDGRSVAFVRVLDEGEPAEVAVLTVPVLGGAERKIAAASLPHSSNRADGLLDWFPDSQNIVIVDGGASGERCALFGVNTRTGERWRLTSPLPVGPGDVDPAVSPDGRGLVFTRSITNETTGMYLLRLNERFRPVGEPELLIAGAGSRGPVWTPDGREILYASGARHYKRLARLRVAPGSIPELLPIAAEGTFGLSVAISRRWQVAYVRSHGDVDLVRTELRNDGKTGPSTPFFSSTFVDHLPEYSPDGKRIAFVSTRSGSQQIWLGDAAGENLQQLTFFTGNLEAAWPRWSPDGRRLVCAVGRSVYLLSVDGGAPVVRFKDVADREAVADWSRDGKWIFFISNRTGREEVWRDTATGIDTHASQVTHNGATAVRASPDGKFIYYTKGTSPAELWRTALEGNQDVVVVDRLSTHGNFAVTSAGLYFISPRDGTDTGKIIFMDARTLTRRTVGSSPMFPQWGLTVSPDGRFLVNTTTTGSGSDLMLVENFR